MFSVHVYMCISESERDKQVQGYAISQEVWIFFCKLILKIIVTQKGFNSTLMATTVFFSLILIPWSTLFISLKIINSRKLDDKHYYKG